MISLKRIIASCFLGFAMCAVAKSDDKIIIIEGHFFNEFPVSTSEIVGMGNVSTTSGAKATLFKLANPLPEAAFKYAIAAEDVDDAANLLKGAETARVLTMSFASEPDSLISVGAKFPQFTATDINGKTWTNSDIDGKAMALNLWFTGCGPCRAEMPVLSQWKDEMPDVMFFSATYEDAATARAVLEKQGFNWTALVNDVQFKEWIGNNGYPMTIVVDKTGTISHIEHGTSPVQRDELKAKIQAVR